MAVYKMTYDNRMIPLEHANQALTAEVTLLNARCKQYAEAYEYLKEQILDGGMIT